MDLRGRLPAGERRRERLTSALAWGGFAALWIGATALLPLPRWLAVAGGDLPGLPTLGLIVWLAATGGYLGRAAWQRFEADAPGPEDLAEFEEPERTDGSDP